MSVPFSPVVPRLGIATLGSSAFSFNRDAAETMSLGVYIPGKQPVVFNVGLEKAGRHRTDLAVYVHESVHQNLMLNTSFGLLTQILSKMAMVIGPAPYTACYEEQWGVQELDATYAEHFAVAIAFPDQFDESRRGLPSGVLNQPPYRELFDSMSRVLPLAPGLPRQLLYARYLAVHALACCSMSSDCLAALPGSRLDADHLAEHVRAASPADRFNRMVWELLEKDALNAIVDAVATSVDAEYLGRDVDRLRELPFPRQDHFPAALEGMLRHVRDTPVQSESNLIAEAQAAQAALADWYGAPFSRREPVVRRKEDPLPVYADSPEYHARIRQTLPGRTSAARLEALIAACQRDGRGMALLLALKGTDECWLSAQPYMLANPPHPIVGPPPEGAPPLPDSLQLVVPTDDLLAVLQQFPSFPHVATFIKSSWRFWNATPNATELLANKVRVCSESELSEPHMRELLTFEDLHEGAQAFLVSTSKDGLLTGVFASRRKPGVYAIQRVPRGPGAGVFSQLTERLGVGSPRDASEIEQLAPHVDLLTMIGF